MLAGLAIDVHTGVQGTGRHTEPGDERLIVRRLVQRACRFRHRPGEQAIAPIGPKAPPFGNPGARRRERRGERVRKQHRRVESTRSQRRAVVLPARQRAKPAATRQRQHLIDIVHQREQRCDRAARSHGQPPRPENAGGCRRPPATPSRHRRASSAPRSRDGRYSPSLFASLALRFRFAYCRTLASGTLGTHPLALLGTRHPWHPLAPWHPWHLIPWRWETCRECPSSARLASGDASTATAPAGGAPASPAHRCSAA